MRAWVCENYGKPWSMELRDLPRLPPKPNEVQVAIRAAGVAFGEILIIEGRYQVVPPLPYIPGNEGSGVVVAVGSEIRRYRPGDRVIVVSFTLSGGTLSGFLNVGEESLLPLPDNLSFEEGAAFASNYYTAYVGLLRRGQLKAGETVVVHGSAGGLGLAGIQTAKLFGARVIGTGSNDEKLATVTRMGADHVINHVQEPMRERILELTSGRGADLFFDPVGGDLFDLSMRAIAPGGRILVLGFTSERFAAARTNILLVKGISVVGVDAKVYRNNSDGQGDRDMSDLLGLVRREKIIPFVGATFDFEQAIDAYRYVLDRKSVGKCVLKVTSDPV